MIRYGSVAIGLFLSLLASNSACLGAEVRQGTASWYSVASTTREHTGGPRHVMANGSPLNDAALTCASWDYPFGTVLRVCNPQNHRCVKTVVSDRGPSHRLVRRGRIVDLSRRAFASIAPLSAGVIRVSVEAVR